MIITKKMWIEANQKIEEIFIKKQRKRVARFLLSKHNSCPNCGADYPPNHPLRK
jgi:hypothetical protein